VHLHENIKEGKHIMRPVKIMVELEHKSCSVHE